MTLKAPHPGSGGRILGGNRVTDAFYGAKELVWFAFLEQIGIVPAQIGAQLTVLHGIAGVAKQLLALGLGTDCLSEGVGRQRLI